MIVQKATDFWVKTYTSTCMISDLIDIRSSFKCSLLVPCYCLNIFHGELISDI